MASEDGERSLIGVPDDSCNTASADDTISLPRAFEDSCNTVSANGARSLLRASDDSCNTVSADGTISLLRASDDSYNTVSADGTRFSLRASNDSCNTVSADGTISLLRASDDSCNTVSADGTISLLRASDDSCSMASVDGATSLLGASDNYCSMADGSRSLLGASDNYGSMALVGGTISLLGSSDEMFKIMCDPCKLKRVEHEAGYYCTDCKEYLCRDCKNYHGRFKWLKGHKILSVDRMSKQAPKLNSQGCNVLCTCNQNRDVEVYCQEHDDVICISCKISKHNKCTIYSIKEESATYSMERFDSVLNKFKNLKTTMSQLQKERYSDLNLLKIAKDKCKTEIMTFRRELVSLSDDLEKTTLKELEKCALEQDRDISKDISLTNAVLEPIDSDCKLLETVKKKGNREIMFAADVCTSKNFREFQQNIRDMESLASRPALLFVRDMSLSDIQKRINSLGCIRKCVSDVFQSDQVVLGMKIETSKQVAIGLHGEKRNPWISGCCFMPSGEIVLCDCNNKSIKVLNESKEVQGHLPLSTAPWDVSVIDDKYVIITLPDVKQLRYVRVFPQLEPGRIVQLDKRCVGVDVIGSEIYSTCHNDGGGEGEIRVLDLNGHVKRRIGVNQDGSFLFTRPIYIAVSGPSGRIYISDVQTAIVSCLSSAGKIVYQYKDERLKTPNGIFVDTGDNIFVCGCRNENVQVVTSDGRKHETLVSSNDGLSNPLSIAFRYNDRTLIIGCAQAYKLFYMQLA